MAVFEVSEFVNTAVKDEEIGEAFYRALAGGVKESGIKDALLRIADQEKYHASRFREMLKEVKGTKVRQEYAGQYEAYLKTLLENRAFLDAGRAVETAKKLSVKDGLKMAVNMERDTIIFYDEILKFVPKTNEKFVADIIGEEKGHLVELSRLLNM
jgi:rubrerythrin